MQMIYVADNVIGFRSVLPCFVEASIDICC